MELWYFIAYFIGLITIIFLLKELIFGSNERKSVRKHEQKKEICNDCGSEDYYDFENIIVCKKCDNIWKAN